MICSSSRRYNNHNSHQYIFWSVMKVNITKVTRKETGHLFTQMDQNMKVIGRRVLKMDLENIHMQMVIGTKDRGKITVRKDMECIITVELKQHIQVNGRLLNVTGVFSHKIILLIKLF